MAEPYSINIEPNILDDLRYRLSKTRWPNQIDSDKWETGTNAGYLKELCEYWMHDFNWQKNEGLLNSFSHFKTSIDGKDLHFIHEKGEGPHSTPLLLIHGYPDTFVRFVKVISLLKAADPDGFSFDLVIPSIPGYGFSGIPTETGMNTQRIGRLFTKLMTEELGYPEFFVHGGDWGSSIAEQMARVSPQCLKGIHLADIPWYHLYTIPADHLTEPEKRYVEKGQQWGQREGAYAIIQSTKPQSLAYGLNDSPAGLAGWIIEKFYGWSDCDGKLENVFTKDELLTNLTIYWATQTINSAHRIYYEAAIDLQKNKEKEIKKIEVPTAVAVFSKDMVSAPREFAERIFNVQQWAEIPKGGHFTAMEQPQLFAENIRSFIKLLSAKPAALTPI
jgi:pimeloyl-ACP methyl ester carboxylesterase